MSGFISEIAIVVILYLILKKYWNTKVKEYFGNFVIGMNVFACILYLYGFYSNIMPYGDAFSKILLHSIVAIIIHTLFTLDEKNKIKWN